MNLRDIFLAGAFAQGGGGAVSPEQITEAVNNYLDKNPVGVDLAMTGAAVGQIAKITAVDASGVPTAWEPVDMPSGGGSEEWELMATVDMVQDATYAKVDLPAPVKKLWVWVKSNSSSLLSNTAYLRIAVGEMAYNNHILSGAGMVHGSETWTEFQWFVDMLGNGKPRYQCYVGNKVYAGYYSNYAGPVNPSSIYITSADATGIFNANTFYVFGVRA